MSREYQAEEKQGKKQKDRENFEKIIAEDKKRECNFLDLAEKFNNAEYTTDYDKWAKILFEEYFAKIRCTPDNLKEIANIINAASNIVRYSEKGILDPFAFTSLAAEAIKISREKKWTHEAIKILGSLTECGFSLTHISKAGQKQIANLSEQIEADLSSSNYSATSCKDAMLYLVRLKNLGLIDSFPQEKIKKLLENIAQAISLRQEHDEVALSCLCETLIYCEGVLKMSFSQNLKEFATRKKSEMESQIHISHTQNKIFSKIIEYLSKSDQENEWGHIPSQSSNSVKVGDLEIVLESGYCEFGGALFKTADIAIKDSDGHDIAIIEIDGPTHYIRINDTELPNGATLARNKLIEAASGARPVIFPYFDIDKAIANDDLKSLIASQTKIKEAKRMAQPQIPQQAEAAKEELPTPPDKTQEADDSVKIVAKEKEPTAKKKKDKKKSSGAAASATDDFEATLLAYAGKSKAAPTSLEMQLNQLLKNSKGDFLKYSQLNIEQIENFISANAQEKFSDLINYAYDNGSIELLILLAAEKKSHHKEITALEKKLNPNQVNYTKDRFEAFVTIFQNCFGANYKQAARPLPKAAASSSEYSDILAITNDSAGEALQEAIAAGNQMVVRYILSNENFQQSLVNFGDYIKFRERVSAYDPIVQASESAKRKPQIIPLTQESLQKMLCCYLLPAVKHGNIPAIDYLIKLGANVNTRIFNTSIINYAIKQDDFATTKFLLQKGAIANAIFFNGKSPFRICSLKMAEFLIQNGVDINCPDSEGFTPIHHAAAANKADIIELLCKNGANPNQKRMNLLEVMTQAIAENLIDLSPFKDPKNPRNINLREFCLNAKTMGISFYISYINPDDINNIIIGLNKLFAENGIFITIEASEIYQGEYIAKEETPMLLAAQERGWKAIEQLLKYGINIHAFNKSCMNSPYNILCELGCAKILERLRQRGILPQLTEPNDQNITPLLSAMISCNTATIDFVLQNGGWQFLNIKSKIDEGDKNIEGKTPALLVFDRAEVMERYDNIGEMLEKLVACAKEATAAGNETKIDFDIPDENRLCALYHAYSFLADDITEIGIKTLLENGARFVRRGNDKDHAEDETAFEFFATLDFSALDEGEELQKDILELMLVEDYAKNYLYDEDIVKALTSLLQTYDTANTMAFLLENERVLSVIEKFSKQDNFLEILEESLEEEPEEELEEEPEEEFEEKDKTAKLLLDKLCEKINWLQEGRYNGQPPALAAANLGYVNLVEFLCKKFTLENSDELIEKATAQKELLKNETAPARDLSGSLSDGTASPLGGRDKTNNLGAP